MRLPVLVLCAALAVSAAAAARAEDAVLLRYQMAQEPLTYRTRSSMEQTQSTGQRRIEIRFTQQELERRSLDGVDDDGNFRIERQNQQLKAMLRLGAQDPYEFDSTTAERPQANPLARDLNPFFERLSGATLQFTHTPRGEVVAVRGYRELFGEELKGNDLAMRFAGGGSDRYFKFGISELFVVLPEEAVAPGDQWESEFVAVFPQLGRATGKKIYDYEGPGTFNGRPSARITIKTELELDVAADAGDGKVSGRLSVVRSSGTAHVDPEKGQLLSLKSSYTLAGNLSVENGGAVTPISSEQVRTIEIELVEEEAPAAAASRE